MIKVAFCTVPHVGGMYSVYQRLREVLLPRGISVYGVQVGDESDRFEIVPNIRDAGCVSLCPDEKRLPIAARALVDWLERERIDILIPMSCPAAMAAVPHLPPSVKVITRCIEMTRMGYRLASGLGDRVSRIVVLTPVQQSELKQRYGVPADKITLIPCAVDTAHYSCDPAKYDAPVLQIAFVGRLYQHHKNIFSIPGITTRLKELGCDYRLVIAGWGNDADALAAMLRQEIAKGSVQMLGAVPPAKVRDILAATAVFIMTSEFEGFGNALIEAMAAGAVPVATRIPGVTDITIDEGHNGLLCPFNEPRCFADAIHSLNLDRPRLHAMGRSAIEKTARCFSLEENGNLWERLLREVHQEKNEYPAPRPWREFRPHPAFRRSRLRWLPETARKHVRQIVGPFIK